MTNNRFCGLFLIFIVFSCSAFAVTNGPVNHASCKEVRSDSHEMEAVARCLYEKVVLKGFDMSLLSRLCTPGFVERLRKANTIYESGYAVWLLRTGVQDGPEESAVLSVKSEGPCSVLVTYSDLGYKGSTRLIMVRDREGWKVDNAVKDDGTPIFD